MGAVADFVSDVVDTVGDVVETVGDVAEDVVQAAGDAVETVGETVGDVVEGALQDPIGTMASVAAIATQQYYLLPAISAGKVVANGGDLDDALKAAAITYVAGEVGGMAGDQVSTATQYGTELGSQQTAMLAAQNAGMGVGNALGGATGAAVGAGTGALLSGGDVGQAVLGGLAGYGMNLGMNAAGQVVNEFGDVIADSYDEFLASQNQTADQPGDYPTTVEDLIAADTELGGIPSTGMVGDQPGDYDTTPEEVATSEQILSEIPTLDQITTGDQPGDYPTTVEDLTLENELMGQVGDQPGDYDTTPEEVAASEETLGGLPTLDEQPIGDQPGDYPTTPEELAAADEELAQLPAAEDYADQPGDYDTTAEEVAASEEALAQIPDAPSKLNISGIQDYLTNQYKKAFLKNLLGGSGGVSMGTFGLGALGSLGASSQTDEESSEPTYGNVVAPTQDFSLFDPTANMSWAPQTKIGGLGAAGKYINQEQDTYYVNPEQAKKEARDSEYQFGWETPDEYQADPYYEYEEPTQLAAGGLAGHNPEFFSEGGMGNRYVRGDGDGTSDSVPAMLASGEFVIPADVVSNLGNGDNDAGAHVLDEFMKAIRKHKRAADPSELPEDSKGPLSYLEEAMKKAKK